MEYIAGGINSRCVLTLSLPLSALQPLITLHLLTHSLPPVLVVMLKSKELKTSRSLMLILCAIHSAYELQMCHQVDRAVDQVVANDTPEQYEMLEELMRRGDTNGVKNLRIVQKEELHRLEANLQPNATAALLAPGAALALASDPDCMLLASTQCNSSDQTHT